jgi:hypothetical protein
MPQPIAICLEDLDESPGRERYIRCVALPGRVPGLAVSQAARIVWKSDDPIACELWVSADERLILLRPDHAPEVRVQRAGRGIGAPFGKPVVLLDQDEFSIQGHSFRVHIHGQTASVHAPTALGSKLSAATRLAAAVTLGAATIGCPSQPRVPGNTPVEVRDNPPSPMPDPRPPPPPPPLPPPPPAPAIDAGAAQEAGGAVIEVREAPPSVAAPPAPSEPKDPRYAKPPAK